MNTLLTPPMFLDYGVPALDASSAGIDTPKPKRVILALIRRAFFVPAMFMVGCMEALRSAVCSLDGSINSVQPAAIIRLIPHFGGFKTKEALLMGNSRTKPSTQSPQADQIGAIERRISRLLDHHDPLSPEFNDVLGISRALRGLHPRCAFKVRGYVSLLEKPAKSLNVRGLV